MKKVLFFLYLYFLIITIKAQNPQQCHWETVVYSYDNWQYWVGTTVPDTDWRKVDFNASQWLKGKGGFGFGDGDDSTIIPQAISVFTRIEFNLIDTANIVGFALHIDYDDAFVAYINNVEIARANIGEAGVVPAYDQAALTYREAEMYQGVEPDCYFVCKSDFKKYIKQGMNVLSVEVHNENINSSDMSCIAFLSVALKTGENFYGKTPDWFYVPNSLLYSELPIIKINTNGQQIVDEPKITADMGIIYNGPGKLNYLDDPFNNYNGKIGIEYRGWSSSEFPKKSWGIETRDAQGEDLKVSLLDFPEESDWILYAPYNDKSLMRNFLTYNIVNSFSPYYNVRSRFCELYINDSYWGVYVFMEKIKRDKNRVNIAKLNPDEITGDDLTGGYIVKVDWPDTTKNSGWTSYSSYPDAKPIDFLYEYPKIEDISEPQRKYIQSYIDSFETALNHKDFGDPVKGFRKYADANSFVDYFLMSELSKNIDCYRFSVFMYKDKKSKDGRLKVGPLWDYDIAYGNCNYGTERADSTGLWLYKDHIYRMYWWKRMLEDPTYCSAVFDRWFALRKTKLHTDTILKFIDATATFIDNAQTRNFEEWKVLGKYVWPNKFIGQTYQEEIDFFKNWIKERLNWMDNNITNICIPDAVVCNKSKSEIWLEVAPNPFSDNLSYNFYLAKNSKVEIKLYNMLGVEVATLLSAVSAEGRYAYKSPTGSLPKGIYFLSVYIDNNRAIIKKIIKN